MKRKNIKYSKKELDFLTKNQTLSRIELTKLFNTKFKRNLSKDNIKGKCTRMGLKTGRTGFFKKGSIPFNKGKKFDAGGRSHLTRFIKGNKPHNKKFEGHEMVNKEGYTLISIKEKNPHTGYERRYVLKHRYLWKQANGEIPEKHIITFKDGDKLNLKLSNLECIPMVENMFRNQMQYKELPNEVKETANLVAKLKSSIVTKARI